MTLAAEEGLPRPKQARSELSTRRLLEAATDLIAEKGYDRTTLAAIGKRAGYSHGLVTQRFGSKSGLLSALMSHEKDLFDEQRRSSAELTGPATLTAFIDLVRTNLRREPAKRRAIYSLIFEAFKSVPALRSEILKFNESTRRQIERDLKRGIAAGEIARVDVRAYARYFVAMLRGAEYQWLLEPTFDIDGFLAWFSAHVRDELTQHERATLADNTNTTRGASDQRG